jgi:predicted NUDIX family phosphoesterase
MSKPFSKQLPCTVRSNKDDFSKQQIIIYTAILNKGYVLMYYRAREKDNQIVKVNVDPRLGGQYSIGFGGHTADKDRLEAILSIEGFKDLLPALFPELAMVMSTTKARVTEMYEELGLEPQDFKYLKLLGTFYLKFAPKQLIKGSQESVHAVHTAVAAVAEINEQTIGDKSLKLPRSEFGGAEWVKLTNLVKTFTDIEKAGGTVEKWSWILAKDFLDKKY